MRLVRESGAGKVFFNRDPDPFGRSVEERLSKEAAREDLRSRVARMSACMNGMKSSPRPVVPFGSSLLIPRPGRSFPRWLRAGRLRNLPRRGKISSWNCLPLPLGIWRTEARSSEPGEKAARTRLADISGRKGCLATVRSGFPGKGFTSRISQDLRFGLVSIREVVAAMCAASGRTPGGSAGQCGQVSFRAHLARILRLQLLWHFPEVLEQEFRKNFAACAWPGEGRAFRALGGG